MGKYLTLLALWVICLFTFAMFATYFSEWLQSSGFFGDIQCVYNNFYAFDNTHIWGARHVYYIIMCILLFLISCARIITWSFKYWEKREF